MLHKPNRQTENLKILDNWLAIDLTIDWHEKKITGITEEYAHSSWNGLNKLTNNDLNCHNEYGTLTLNKSIMILSLNASGHLTSSNQLLKFDIKYQNETKSAKPNISGR